MSFSVGQCHTWDVNIWACVIEKISWQMILNCINIPCWIQSHKRFFFYLLNYIIQALFKKKKIMHIFLKLRCMTMQAVLSRKIRGFCVVITHVFCREIKVLWIGYTNSIVHEDKGCFVCWVFFFLVKRHRQRSQNVFFRFLITVILLQTKSIVTCMFPYKIIKIFCVIYW